MGATRRRLRHCFPGVVAAIPTYHRPDRVSSEIPPYYPSEIQITGSTPHIKRSILDTTSYMLFNLLFCFSNDPLQGVNSNLGVTQRNGQGVGLARHMRRPLPRSSPLLPVVRYIFTRCIIQSVIFSIAVLQLYCFAAALLAGSKALWRTMTALPDRQ